MNTNFATPIDKMYSVKTTLSFPENGYPEKQSVLEAINEYALSNNFTVKIKDGNQRYLSLPARGDNEHCHNHPITPNNLASSHQGRMSLLTSEDAIVVSNIIVDLN
ncbi:hypothetical protein PHYBLDRAFT_151518 [Phycomyces blakesleeanus NRRL 1555(-)]|uniref:Uncharacterized protein n=1 Tax=Phycomyces blakesleeanus (strain ATCC 8743b / DSM 1359 / FGSC 10004 / NBRC 33097 / NRRL 1555) TaxID=763407 RepID=A0A167K4H7_PHYB8|nr:hypothetical protein PHYBLDRAFT_151518 [Phycomyces blakesleeanus NRRL 1555(-)]OAD67266.1 hypothetical protein PHYBLDRAFT_151518 [Phycomyces blakesleeanus NRRL 1555(-)]|eukprot:XP_018285306.1 hypothetical protein PHYBLDRAFT_151518 [Phycomyces blakesleeanus NRRL 1555(-)]